MNHRDVHNSQSSLYKNTDNNFSNGSIDYSSQSFLQSHLRGLVLVYASWSHQIGGRMDERNQMSHEIHTDSNHRYSIFLDRRRHSLYHVNTWRWFDFLFCYIFHGRAFVRFSMRVFVLFVHQDRVLGSVWDTSDQQKWEKSSRKTRGLYLSPQTLVSSGGIFWFL